MSSVKDTQQRWTKAVRCQSPALLNNKIGSASSYTTAKTFGDNITKGKQGNFQISKTQI